MSSKRRHFSDTQKADAVRRHLSEKVAVSDLADELGVQPSQIHQWVKQVLDQAEKSFERSKNKYDRKDAERLAKLLYIGEVPTVHLPSLDVRNWRELINYRNQVIAKRTRAKCAIRALLRSAGVTAPRHPGLWTKQGTAWLRQAELPTISQQLRRDLLMEEIDTLSGQLKRIDQALANRAQQVSTVALLRNIPGVGIRTAEAVVAFIDDPHRFPNAKTVGRYFGLVPCQDQSGDKNRLGHITREGPSVVRKMLDEAAWQALRRSPTVRAYYELYSAMIHSASILP